jgi:hypothetical protein
MATTDSHFSQVGIDSYLRCWIREASSLGGHRASSRTPTGKFNTTKYLASSHSSKTFKEAIEVVSSDLFLKLMIPNFAMGLTKRTSRVKLGFEELLVSHDSSALWHHASWRTNYKKYIREMIQERSKSYRDCSDLFSNLIAANENDSEGLRLTDEEVVGNIFIFLIGKLWSQFQDLSNVERQPDMKAQHILSLSPLACWRYIQKFKRSYIDM